MSGLTRAEQIVMREGLPASLHTERVVLGAMMDDPAALMEATNELTALAFSIPSHRSIFTAMATMHDAGKPVDLVALMDELERRRELESVGNQSYLASLFENIPRFVSVGGYCAILREKAAERALLLMMEELSGRLAAKEATAGELLAEMAERLGEVETGTSRTAYTHVSEDLPAFLEAFRAERDRPEGLVGISTGIATLDEFTTGYRNGELTYVGAMPGRGKTAFMLQGLLDAARQGIPVGLISLEMRKNQLLRRLAVRESGVPAWKVRDAKKTNATDFRNIAEAAVRLEDMPMYLNDVDGLRPHEITAVARRMVRKHKVRILFVDFVQIVREESGRTTKESVDRVSAALRSIAKTLNIPVVVASQLSRGDKDPNRVPVLADLRESGNLEQDAHCVMFLYRPIDRQSSKFTGEDQVIVAKQREGGIGAIPVHYCSEFLHFEVRDE